ncbi:MAG: permease [Myxococcota bacterium]|jgi:hypothetical protein|nr:permease [Myxococcota bacterium]
MATTFANATVEIMLELAPWFLLGMGVSGLLHVVLPRDFVERQLAGRGGVVKAVFLGIPLPLCSCGVIPAGLGLKRDGASNGASLGFLISTPQTGVDSILVSASFLGWPFALFKVIAAGITGIAGGWLADRVPEDSSSARDFGQAGSVESARGVGAFFTHAYDLLASIWRWLVFGVLVSAAIDVFVPVGTLSVFAELGAVGAGFAVLLISLPLYVCATASVPIAASLVASGMPVGAALVFLMAGPATNMATMGAIFRGFGGRHLAIYLAVLIVGSIGFGALFDSLITTASGPAHIHGEHGFPWWAIASAIALTAMLAHLALRDALAWWREHTREATSDEISIEVSGMSCNKCVRKVETALLDVDGVRSAEVLRNPDRAIVRGSAALDAIHAAIEAAGYQVATS